MELTSSLSLSFFSLSCFSFSSEEMSAAEKVKLGLRISSNLISPLVFIITREASGTFTKSSRERGGLEYKSTKTI